MALLKPKDDSDHEVVAERTEMRPIDDRDPASLWRRFLDFMRQSIGLKPLDLSERWIEAKVRSAEIDNETRLLNAKLEYERTMAEVRRINAETDAMQKSIHIMELDGAVGEMVRKYFHSSCISPDEAFQELQEVIARIQSHGGSVNIEVPDESDEAE